MKRIILFLSLICIAMFTASCSEQTAPSASDEGSVDKSSSGCNYVFLRKVRLHRGGFDGVKRGPGSDPEIEFYSKVGSDYREYDLHSVNDVGVNYNLSRYLGYSCDDAIFYWNERDGSNLDVTVSYKGVSLNAKIDNKDDFLGATKVSLKDLRFWATTQRMDNLSFQVCAVPYLSRARHGGQRLEAVKHLQRRLKFPESWVDGYFGPTTEKYVKAFQQKAFPNQPGEWDGKVGPQTWGKLGCG